jgi:hypothetical protein
VMQISEMLIGAVACASESCLRSTVSSIQQMCQ